MGPTWDLRGLAHRAHSNPIVGFTWDLRGFAPGIYVGLTWASPWWPTAARPNPTEIPYGISMGHSGHGPLDLTMGQQWVGPDGAHVGFEWASPSPCESHGPTVAHGNPRRDLDGLAIWELSPPMFIFGRKLSN